MMCHLISIFNQKNEIVDRSKHREIKSLVNSIKINLFASFTIDAVTRDFINNLTGSKSLESLMIVFNGIS